MKKSSFLALAIAPMILGAPLAVQAQSVSTDPVGFVKTLAPSGYTPVGINMLKPAEFSGLVTEVDGNTITLSAEPSLDANAHYIEIADGTLEGDRIDIASVSGSVVTLDLAAAHNTIDGNAVEVGSRIVIREHYTLADVTASVGAGNLHTGENFPDSSDQVLTLEGGGFQAHAIFDGEWYDIQGNPADHKIIPPGSGFMFLANPDGGERSLELLALGEVRTNDFVRPLSAGYQLVAIGFPIDGSPAGLGMTTEFFTATADQPEDADQILNYADGGFQLNYLFEDGNWYDVQGSESGNSQLFAAGGAAVVFRHEADPDFRISNQVD